MQRKAGQDACPEAPILRLHFWLGRRGGGEQRAHLSEPWCSVAGGSLHRSPLLAGCLWSRLLVLSSKDELPSGMPPRGPSAGAPSREFMVL